ncbi:MAG: protein-methionine-sulfoxide reductase catalytic subunit MsrP [Nitrospinota bacterium]|nr:protein-methionine-sulfoxide reductase catalytic subunit MsrP [Nitrospinota bacterium]
MFVLKASSDWDIPESDITSEELYLNRRQFLENTGKLGCNLLALSALPNFLLPTGVFAENSTFSNANLEDKVTSENLTSRYNNFYEFGTNKATISFLSKKLRVRPWTIKVEGLVHKQKTLDVDKIIQAMPLEQRVYRLRCVETWSAIIPWSGFPLRELIKLSNPLSTARYIKFKTFLNPNIAPGQKNRFWEPWPYVEGLSMPEAMHNLAFIATGMYGHELNPQNGAPIRLVVPWKYGFKSIKSIDTIEFVKDPPRTFWQTVFPMDYDFWANVEPTVPYAKWDQRFELPLGSAKKETTLLYNGYAAQVGKLYS